MRYRGALGFSNSKQPCADDFLVGRVEAERWRTHRGGSRICQDQYEITNYLSAGKKLGSA
jgi:hypothetical protein